MAFEPMKELEVELFGKKYTLHPEEDLEIDMGNLGECLQTQASTFAFYATLRDQAQNQLDALETSMTQIFARLDDKYRKDGLPNGFKITEESIKYAVRASKTFRDAQDAYINFKVTAATLESLVWAFQQRRDMLVALYTKSNNNMFQESEPRIRPDASTRNIGKFPGKRDDA